MASLKQQYSKLWHAIEATRIWNLSNCILQLQHPGHHFGIGNENSTFVPIIHVACHLHGALFVYTGTNGAQ